MFESLGYAERKVSARQALALPIAMALQVTIGATYLLYSVFSPETLQPPPVWITALPAIPITLPMAPRNDHAQANAGTKPSKPDGLVEPRRGDLQPPGHQEPVEPTGNTSASGGDGVPGGYNRIGDEIPPPIPPAEVPRTVNVGQLVEIPRPLHQVPPVYPAAARAMWIPGKVILEVVVNEDGRVTDVRVLQTSNALFNSSAVDAVRQWQYTKPLAKASGQSVACMMTVVVNFQMK